MTTRPWTSGSFWYVLFSTVLCVILAYWLMGELSAIGGLASIVALNKWRCEHRQEAQPK